METFNYRPWFTLGWVLLLLTILLSWSPAACAAQTGEERLRYLCLDCGYEYHDPDYGRTGLMRNLPANKEFSIRFSKDVDYNSINFDTIQIISKDSGEAVSLSFDRISGRVIKVIPRAALSRGKSYYLIVHNTIKSWDGKRSLERGVVQEFAVGCSGDSFKIDHMNFVSGNEAEIKFTDMVDKTSAASIGNYIFSNNKPLSARVLEDGKTVRIKLSSNISSSGSSKITVTKNIFDLYLTRKAPAASQTIFLKTSSSSAASYNGSVCILGESVTLQNTTVNGDVYISGDKANLQNLTITGTLFIDPGVYGSTAIANVHADTIEILSGKDETVVLSGVQAAKLLVKSRSKVRIKADNSTWIANVSVQFRNNGVALELTGGSAFDVVAVDSNSIDPSQLTLNGSFGVVNTCVPLSIICGDATTIQGLNIDLGEWGQVKVAGGQQATINSISVASEVVLGLESVTVAHLDVQTDSSQPVDLTIGSSAVVSRLTTAIPGVYPDITILPGGSLTRSPVADLAATNVTETTVSLKWTAPADAVRQKIQQCTIVSGGSAAPAWTDSTVQTALTASSAQVVVTGLTAANTYRFRLVVTGGPNEGESNTVELATIQSTDFATANLQSGTAVGATSITWGDSLPNGAAKVMYRIITSGTTYTFPGIDTVFTGGLAAVKGADITGSEVIAGSQVVIVATDAGNKIKAYKVVTLTTGNIKQGVSATISGTLSSSASEVDIVSGGKTIVVSLAYGEWVSDVAIADSVRNALYDGLTAASNTAQWAKVITALKSAGTDCIARNSSTLLTITLPSVSSYDIDAAETITLNIPAAAISGATAPLTAAPSVSISAITTAAISGTVITAPPGEAEIVAGGKTIIITLSNGQWASDITTSTAKLNALFDGMQASGTETAQWAKVVTVLKTVATGSVTRTSNTVLSIVLPATSGYNISANQPVTMTIPASVMSAAVLPAGATGVVAAPGFQIASAVSAVITGTIVDPTNESHIVAGGKTINITLTGGVWSNTIASEAALRNALYAAMTADSTTTEWSKVATALQTAGESAISRVSDTQVTITLPAVSDFNIGSVQTVTVNIPREAISGAISAVAATPVLVINTSATAAVSGSLATGTITERDIVSGGKNLTLTLTGGQWAADIASDVTKRNNLFQGITASGTETAQWTSVINALKSDGEGAIVRSSDTVITISFPETVTYNIRSNQTITVHIPAGSITGSSSEVVAGPSISILAIPSAAITGTITSATESDLVNGGKTLIVTLTDGQWAADIASDSTKRNALFNGLAAETATAEWAEVVAALASAGETCMQRNSAAQITITLPPVSGYDIAARQTVTLTIPSSAMTGVGAAVTAAPSVTIAAVAEVSGTVISTACSENDIIAGHKTVVLTLTDGQWAADIDTDVTKRNILFSGLIAGTETTEWAKVVTALQNTGAAAISRDSDTRVTITLQPTATYNITANQIIAVTIPASAVTGVTGPVYTRPSIPIASVPVAVITGTATNACTETEIVEGGKTIIITLSGGRWAIDIASNAVLRNALFTGFFTGSEASELDKVVTALQSSGESAIIRNSSTKVTITLPAVPGYNISADQTISLRIPKECMSGSVENVDATPDISVDSL